MQDIISLLDKKENISNEISRLQRAQQTISEQVKDYVKNLSSEKKRPGGGSPLPGSWCI